MVSSVASSGIYPFMLPGACSLNEHELNKDFPSLIANAVAGKGNGCLKSYGCCRESLAQKGHGSMKCETRRDHTGR
jgi:hypothetical protein